ncbi:MAG: helix-turn-helix domain-containing protein [Stackebrandtia sp.]
MESRADCDADQPWWRLSAVRSALAAGRWDVVLNAAMRATGLRQQDIVAATGLSQPYVSRVISGERSPRQLDTLAALCDGLGIPRRLAGLADDGKEETTRRRQFLASASLTAVAGAMAAVMPQDSLLDLATPTATYRRAEATMPSPLLRPPAVAHLNFLRHMAAEAAQEGRAGDSRRLNALVSEAAGFVGWLAVDCDDRAVARRSYLLAVEAAKRTRQQLLGVYMTASLGQFAAISGDVRNAIAIVRKARQSLPKAAPPIAVVWLDCVEASVLALNADEHALRLMDHAATALTDAEPVWPWLVRFDAAKLDSFRHTVAVRLRRDPDQWPAPRHR